MTKSISMLNFRKVTLHVWYFLIFISVILILILWKKSIPFITDCEKICPYSSKLINGSVQFDSSHIIRHYPDFVCPQNFRNLADWIYSWPSQFEEHVEPTTDEARLIARCLPPGSIIYVRIWAIDDFFELVYPHLINNFVLITGEGDLSSPTDLQYLERSDSKIIHWFGQNGQYDVSESTKFTHIPIGINCYQMAEAIRNVHLQLSIYKSTLISGDEDEPKYYTQPLDVSHRKLNQTLVLINFDKNTDTTGLRSRVWKDLCTSENEEDFPFITCLGKKPAVEIKQLPVVYKRNRQYPFWLSPRGNGLDCHRTWEALYLDIIPIVWNSSLNILYANLPVVIINNHSELNETFLREKFNEISQKKLSQTKFYQYEKLRHAYWRRLILSKSRHTNRYQRQRQCWRASTKIDKERF